MNFLVIQNKIQNAKNLDFSNILNSSFELFKKVWLKGFVVILIIVIIAFVISFIFSFLGITSTATLFDNNFEFDLVQYSTLNTLYQIPMSIIMSSISIALLGGFYRICKQVDLGETQKEDYFYFFNGQYIGKVFLIGTIYAIIATVAQMLLFIPYIYVYIPLSYFAIVFANNLDLNETEIVKASFSLGNKKWFFTFGLLFVTGIIAALGIIACGIGILFTMSIVYLPIYFIYKEVIGFEDYDEIQKIGTE